MTYTIRIDDRGRQVLLNALSLVKKAAEDQIVNGDTSQEALQQHEELLQLHRGVLYIQPDPVPEPQPEPEPESEKKPEDLDNLLD